MVMQMGVPQSLSWASGVEGLVDRGGPVAHRASGLATVLSTPGGASEAFQILSEGLHRFRFQDFSSILRNEVCTLAPCIKGGLGSVDVLVTAY